MMLRVLGILVGLLVLSACSDSGDQSSEETPAAGPGQTVTTDGGGFEVNLKTLPDPLETNEHFRLAVSVKALNGGNLDGIEVIADADMPAHGHGMNTKPVIKKTSDGDYEVEGFLFHMPGYWELYIDVVRAGKRERAIFKYDLE